MPALRRALRVRRGDGGRSDDALAEGNGESQGFSPARLERVTGYLQAAVDQGQYAGAVTLIARRGRIVQWQALGYRDVARSAPMRRDAIFQIYSMTKPITSVAALLLMEEGRLTLEDSSAASCRSSRTCRCWRARRNSARLRPAARPITIRHLLTHTTGFAAGEKLRGPAVERLNAAHLDDSPSVEAFAAALAALPLANDPGVRFSYDGVSTQVLSRVIEVVAGMPLDEFVGKRLFTPLRMLDTGFTVPAGKRERIVDMTSLDEAGHVVKASVGVNQGSC